jgi:hypothetical protein
MSLISASLKGLGVASLLAAAFAIRAAGEGATPVAAPAVVPAVVPDTAAQKISPSLDGIPVIGRMARAVTVPSAPNAWGGPRTGSESTLSDRVVNYDIAATLDPEKHTVDGQEKLTWRNRSDKEVRSVYLHMYLNAFEGNGSTMYHEQNFNGFEFRSSVKIKDGEWGHIELGKVSQGGADVAWTYVHPDDGPATDHTVVRFDLPKPVAPGASTDLDIAFHDQLPRVVARTGYFGTFHLIGQWYPKIGVLELPGERGATEARWNVHEFHAFSEFYADFGNFDVKMTVPKGYTVGATGEEQGAPVEAGDKVTYHYVQGDVHDFAWTADNRTAKPLEGTYTGEGSPTVKVKVLYPPEYEATAAPSLKATIDALGYFSKTLGPYPYKTVTVVIPPYNAEEAGGMEYPTFFTADGYSKINPDSVDQFFVDFVNIHEFGHGYFYGILASNEFEEPMLDEGMNDYWDHHMLRAENYKIHLMPSVLSKLGLDFATDPFEVERSGAVNNAPADETGENSWNRLSFNSYGSVYTRTATLMRDLEEAIGRPTMERAMKQYYATWKYRHPSIADLQATLAQASGKPELVNRVFAQQVYTTQKVDDRVKTFTSEEDVPLPTTSLVKGKYAEVTQEQADKAAEDQRKAWEEKNPNAKEGTGPFPFRTTVILRRYGLAVPQTLVVKFADGSSEHVVWNDDKRWARYIWVKPVKAVSAQLDPDELNYLDMNKLDDSRTIKADRSASTRWTSELESLIQLTFSAIATL